MKFLVSEKLKLKVVSSQLHFKELFLSMFFWNTGLITIELFGSTPTRPHNSYHWLTDTWRLKNKQGPLRDLAYYMIKGIIETLETPNIMKEDFILLPEPNMYLLKFFINQEDTEQIFQLISVFKNKDGSLLYKWIVFNFKTTERFIFYNTNRNYFFLQDSNNNNLPKEIRSGLLFTLQYLIGYQYWLFIQNKIFSLKLILHCD